MQQNRKNKGFKVRQIFDMIQANFNQFGMFEIDLSIDEIIVKYYGNHFLKQLNRGKSTQFSYKLWAVCGPSGYCYNFNLYCGKNLDTSERNINLGCRIVLQMIKNVAIPSSTALYFDKYFTNGDLFL